MVNLVVMMSLRHVSSIVGVGFRPSVVNAMVFANDTVHQPCLQTVETTRIDIRSTFVMTLLRNKQVTMSVCSFVVPACLDRKQAQTF